jgi:hypothetical protein
VGADLVHYGRQPTEVGVVVLHLWAGRPDAGGEDLEAGEAGLYQLGDLADGVGARALGEDGVVGVVGVGVAPPALGRFVQGVVKVVARDLGGEVQHGGGATVNGGSRQRKCAVALWLARPADVGVGLDPAWDHDLARRLDNPGRLAANGAGLRHRHDLFPLNGHVPLASARGRDHIASANQ